ncbi:fluoride efflux transporter CrcB [Bacillota bacterium LX-D]|nr:fluoride efflux transporter CrcB [Bacillota bacterium LX-D]
MKSLVYLYVALGGSIGAVSRYYLSNLIDSRGNSIFPWGTFTVNMLGCLIIGLVQALGVEKALISPNLRIFISVGLIGALTTFSTFSLETLNILRHGEFKTALLNIGGSLLIGLLAVWLGLVIGNTLSK